jgi:hypothetical protein
MIFMIFTILVQVTTMGFGIISPSMGAIGHFTASYDSYKYMAALRSQPTQSAPTSSTSSAFSSLLGLAAIDSCSHFNSKVISKVHGFSLSPESITRLITPLNKTKFNPPPTPSYSKCIPRFSSSLWQLLLSFRLMVKLLLW